MAAFYDAPSDLWIPGYDQFGISCWQNKFTREIRYSDTPPRQPPALHPPAYVGDSYYPYLPTGRPFEHAARPPADRFPAWELGKNVQFQSPALNVPEPAPAKGWAGPAAGKGWTGPAPAKGWAGPAAAKGWTGPAPAKGWAGPAPAKGWTGPAAAKGWTAPAAAKGLAAPAVMDARPPPPFPPNNFARSPPPSWPWAPPSQKKSKNEADQWFLQRNGKGEEYYLNTSSWKWQIETPDCLKKYTTRR